MEPKTFAQFNECFPPIMDGVSLTVQNYAYWLNHKYVPTYVVTPSFPGYTDKEEFPVIRYTSAPLPFRPPYRMGLPLFEYSLVPKLKNLPLSLVHAHSPFSAGHLAQKVAQSKGIPLVATFHSKYRDDFERLIPNKALVDYLIHNIVKFFDSADEVWIPQKAVEPTLREYGYKGHVEVVDNGIDFSLSTETAGIREESRKSLGIETKENILLYVGQHIWEKNLKFLIESLTYINEVDFKMVFVGEGYARSDMEKLVHDLHLSEKVKFTGPLYQRNQLMKWYAAADLFVFPSLYDNAPLVLREAAAMQTPGILIEGSTAAEVILNDFNGFLTKNEPRSFANKISWLLNNKSILHNAGENATNTICRSWEDIAGEVYDRYKILIKRKNMVKQETQFIEG